MRELMKEGLQYRDSVSNDSTIRAYIRQAIEETGARDADVIMWHVRSLLQIDGPDADALFHKAYPLIRDDVRNELRARVRAVEQRVVEIAERAGNSQPLTNPEIRAHLMTEFFWVPGSCELIRWDQATPEQHLARAGWLRRMAGGLVRTAELHEEAAAVISAAGVRCLADLDALEAA
jgi:hypothetical protein